MHDQRKNCDSDWPINGLYPIKLIENSPYLMDE